eukprot:GHVU01213914.1.p2 GENE.GHVU01213914.1~~GHVU01213914.1.p2  ORF type:complete len:157 (+),score=17.10 GHVU01213914.1:28-471(+)
MTTAQSECDMTLDIQERIEVNATAEKAFEAILHKLGPGQTDQHDEPMPMVIEAKPGGRWYRDLGNEQGHFWGHVQVIKSPILLELTGPMFMSYPVSSHVQFRVEPTETGCAIAFRHQAFGMIDPEHRVGVTGGWKQICDEIKVEAEK